MVNIKPILDSVRVRLGVVHFPSRYAVRQVMDASADLAALEDNLLCYDYSNYRILSLSDGIYYAVFFPDTGTFFSASDLLELKEAIKG